MLPYYCCRIKENAGPVYSADQLTTTKMASTQSSTPPLDEYLKGIRNEFDRLNHELDETRKQLDEYITKCTYINFSQVELEIQSLIDLSQARELQELRQTTSSCHEGITHTCRITDDNPSPLISSESVSSYHSPLEGEDSASDHLVNTEDSNELPKQERDQEGADVDRNESIAASGTASLPTGIFTDEHDAPAWHVEFNRNTTPIPNLNLMHKLTLQRGINLAFSMDGEYLATASYSGKVSIFHSKTGKRIR